MRMDNMELYRGFPLIFSLARFAFIKNSIDELTSEQIDYEEETSGVEEAKICCVFLSSLYDGKSESIEKTFDERFPWQSQ